MLDKVHWLGHASFCIDTQEAVVYIDPYQLKRNTPKADIVLVTHDHFDHCSSEDIEKIYKPETVIIAAESVANKLSYPVKVMKSGQTVNVGKITIETIPSYNVNKNYHPLAEGNLGFIIQVNQTRIYHAGDTDAIPQMNKIKADIILMPVGGTYTMNAQEAASVANAISPQVAVPMHWGNVVGSRKDAESFKKLCKCNVSIMEIEK